ncbi:ABC transporter permease [Catenuloplanes japonicus]|uniref:ABC transporter permease n=1 Tax=Catenuloplanes japonicus TaxID=33876 RepID=UPI0005259982|nr:ABC transporter permease [Catenuloplanes japonicus]
MRPITALTVSEGRLFLRDGLSVSMGLLFPSLLLVVLGSALPGFREADPDMGGLRPIDVYVPIVVAMALANIAITTLPTHLATHRERGVLRRMATTPAGPGPLLGAQLIVNVIAMLVSVGIAITLGVTVLGVPLPESVFAFAGVLLLATLAMFAIGLLLSAVTPTAKAASGAGMLVYFPMLFFAGVWTPGPTMPETVRRIAEFTPLGAASQALSDAWSGASVAPLSLAVMAGYAIAISLLAARLFRWS